MIAADWRGACVLVTGARGFIGSRLCQKLIASGANVHGVSTQPQVPIITGMRWSQAEVAELDAARGLLNRVRPDIIFHLAGRVTGSPDLAFVEPTFVANLMSTVHLLTAAAERKDHRVVLAASMQEPHQSDVSPRFPSPYAVSKWACGGYARLFHDLYGVAVALARPMMVYGPGQWDMEKLLPYVTVSLLNGESPAIGSGTRELDWVFVDDVVDGLIAVAASPVFDGQAVDLGSGALTSIRTVVEHVAALVGSDVSIRFGAIPDRQLERPRVARRDETLRLIGWSATTPLNEGLRRTVAWYRETCCLPKPA